MRVLLVTGSLGGVCPLAGFWRSVPARRLAVDRKSWLPPLFGGLQAPKKEDRYIMGSSYAQEERPAPSFVQGVFRQFQPGTSAQTNPTPGLTLTLTHTLTPTLTLTLWGGRGRHGQSRGSAACFGGALKKKTPGGRKTRLDQ